MIVEKTIYLTEYEQVYLSKDAFSFDLGEQLWRKYSNQILIEFPSIKTTNKWVLTNQGWVGYIPIRDQLLLVLKPKVPLENIFRMLEYAYNLRSITFFDKQVRCNSLQDFFNLLAKILSKKVLNRARKGFYKNYRDEYEIIPYIRGRIDLNKQITKPWEAKIPCQYQDCTSNNADNQILLWTFYIIIRSGLCNSDTTAIVRQAFRILQRTAEMRPFNAQQCYKRFYNRLNLDYQPMHTLCWFFLEHTGPQFAIGKQLIIPFMVNMPRLYEQFVAQWLKHHLPDNYELRIQERINIGERKMLHFNADLVIYRKGDRQAAYVLDTKYKDSENISPADFSQVVTYSLAKNCPEAVLVYPGTIKNKFCDNIHDIRVRNLSFSIDGDIEEAGKHFLGDLLFSNN